MNDLPASHDRARGALLGLAVGDALGTTLEFTTPQAIPFPTLNVGPHTDITGGGPFDVHPGQVTDDTQLACCLATSLVASGGFDAVDLGQRYVVWREVAFDVGNQTRASLRNVAEGCNPLDAGRYVWLESGKGAAGNGSLMRTAPIGVFFARDAASRRAASIGDSAITHYDPRCALACASFNAAIATALSGIAAPESLVLAAEAELVPAAAMLRAAHAEDVADIDRAVVAIKEDLDAARRADPQVHHTNLHVHKTQGFVRVALRLAFWELLHAPTFEAGVLDVVNRGGDADTNGAITGALLGSFHGAAEIPGQWRDVVLNALQSGPPSPFRDEYHPKRLLALVA